MFIFLDPTGAIYYDDKPFYYNLPLHGERISARTEHPNPCEPDGLSFGAGRICIMKHLDAFFAPPNWWPWWVAEYGPVIGESEEQVGVNWVQLCRISPKTFWRMLRPPFNWGRKANLRGANLQGAKLWKADLQETNLWGANLWEVDLWGAHLRRANLRGANLRGANLWGADLREADLWGANLWGADLRAANLERADLQGADLRGITYSTITVWPIGFTPPGNPQ